MTKPREIRTAAALLSTASGEAHKVSLRLASAVNVLRSPSYDEQAELMAYDDMKAAAEIMATIQTLIIEATDCMANVGARS